MNRRGFLAFFGGAAAALAIPFNLFKRNSIFTNLHSSGPQSSCPACLKADPKLAFQMPMMEDIPDYGSKWINFEGKRMQIRWLTKK